MSNAPMVARRWFRRMAGIVCTIALGLPLASCSLYHEAYREGANAELHAPDTHGYDLRFIEADDQGWFWDPAQATDALSFVRQQAAARDTVVLLFVHGWHHSTCCCDENLEGFKEVLQRLHGELEQPMYRQARNRAGTRAGSQPINVIGIYVGWRGRSLPGLLDYATFWGRKSAARRVGETDFQEFMIRLQQLYDGRSRGDPFLGLVSVGHSFGGEVLLTATSKFFESELQHANPAPALLRAASAPNAPVPVDKALRGFGDMVILVNPAVEAAAYERVNLLARGLRYPKEQTPLLVTFSADNDGPRHALFEWGRIVGSWFTSAPTLADPRERALQREALGVYGGNGEQVTHRLAPVDGSALLEKSTRASTPEALCAQDGGQCRYDWYRWRDPQPPAAVDSLDANDESGQQLPSILGFDFSQELVFSKLRFGPSSAQAMPYQPMIVASVDRNVIDGHNGMFSEPFMDFLIRYIGFVEAKRYLLEAGAAS